MSEKELLSDDATQKMRKMVEDENAAKRSDAVLEHELKTGAQSEMYSCIYCGERRVTLKQ
jgi:hypothetical protein